MKAAVPALLAACCAAGRMVADPLSHDQRAAFRAELRAYLLEHPEVIEEALSGAEARRYGAHVADDLALLDAHAQALFHAPDDWTGGNPDGDVTLVIFVDYADPASGRALAAAHEAAERDGRVRLVVKEAPAPDDRDAERAAGFAQAVLHLAGAAAYLRAQAALFAAPDFAPERLATLSRSLGLDPAAVVGQMAAPETRTRLAATRQLADVLGLGPSPAYVMERTMVRGDLPAAALVPMIQAMRRKK